MFVLFTCFFNEYNVCLTLELPSGQNDRFFLVNWFFLKNLFIDSNQIFTFLLIFNEHQILNIFFCICFFVRKIILTWSRITQPVKMTASCIFIFKFIKNYAALEKFEKSIRRTLEKFFNLKKPWKMWILGTVGRENAKALGGIFDYLSVIYMSHENIFFDWFFFIWKQIFLRFVHFYMNLRK